jgi:hypothetical protein
VDRIGPVNLGGDRRGDVLERLGSLDGVQSARSGPDGDSAADDGDLTGPDVGGDDITWRVTPEPTDHAPLCVEGGALPGSGDREGPPVLVLQAARAEAEERASLQEQIDQLRTELTTTRSAASKPRTQRKTQSE